MWSAAYHIAFNCCVRLTSLIRKNTTSDKSQQMPTMLDLLLQQNVASILPRLFTVYKFQVVINFLHIVQFYLKVEAMTSKILI